MRSPALCFQCTICGSRYAPILACSSFYFLIIDFRPGVPFNCFLIIDNWIHISTLVPLGLIVIVGVLIIGAVSYQFAATWKWLKERLGDINETREREDSISKQSAIRISHSLPDLKTEPVKQEYIQEHKETKKVSCL